MALRINTNISALTAHKNMIRNDNDMSSSLEKLSSGLRINRAADDASGMAIADSLKSQALGLGQAIRNANDGISMVQTADGALDESIKIVNTIKTKAIQAAQDGQTTDSRKAIQADIDKLMQELDTIAKTTSFNNQKLLSGNFTNKKFQIGAYSGETVDVSIASAEATKIGHVTTGLLSASGAGDVRMSIYSNVLNQTVSLKSVTLAFDNNAEHGMAALSDAINLVSDLTGVSAQMKVEVSSQSAVGAGSTGSDFAINGITIGQLNVLANDSDGSLVNAINQKTSQHGITASVDEQGILTLTSTDGRAIQMTGDTGTTLLGSDMSTLGQLKLFQSGANEIIINDAADNVSLNLTAAFDVKGATTTIVDSTLTKNSVIASSSVLKAGTSYGFTAATANLKDLRVTTTQDSTLVAGSVLGSTSVIKAGSILGGDITTPRGTATTTADSLLKTGSIITSGTVLATGTTVTTQFVAKGNTYAAGTTLASDVTVSANVTLTSDMLLKSNSVLDESNSYKAGSYFGADISISGSVTLTTGMTLKSGSVLGLSNSSFLAGSVIGGDITLSDAEVTVNTDMTVKAGSIFADGVMSLAKGSTIGASVTLSTSDVTLAGTMTVAAGSMIAEGSVLKAGTVLTDDIWVAGGNLLKAGTTLTGDAITSGSNYLDAAMTLKANSVLNSGTILAPTATSSSGASATTSLSDVAKYRLSDIDVTTQEGAQNAISIADSALKNLDKVRS
ncbi:MAG: flagellin hook IN motif-containing protein, partial [Thermodesulfobacteriota bacterium]